MNDEYQNGAIIEPVEGGYKEVIQELKTKYGEDSIYTFGDNEVERAFVVVKDALSEDAVARIEKRGDVQRIQPNHQQNLPQVPEVPADADFNIPSMDDIIDHNL